MSKKEALNPPFEICSVYKELNNQIEIAKKLKLEPNYSLPEGVKDPTAYNIQLYQQALRIQLEICEDRAKRRVLENPSNSIQDNEAKGKNRGVKAENRAFFTEVEGTPFEVISAHKEVQAQIEIAKKQKLEPNY